jgi:Na+-driven multidrug efflux pump
LGLPIFGAAALIDGVLDIVLIPHYGVAGAGIAAAVSYWIAAFAFLRIFKQQEKRSSFDVLVIRRSDLDGVGRAIVNVARLFTKTIVRPKLVGERE